VERTGRRGRGRAAARLQVAEYRGRPTHRSNGRAWERASYDTADVLDGVSRPQSLRKILTSLRSASSVWVSANRWKALGVSALTFAVCFSTLTGVRGWHLEPPPDVQSLVVNGTALLFLATTAYRGYHGREFIESWILVFGASVAFTLNLFIPVTRGGLLTLSGYSLVAAVYSRACSPHSDSSSGTQFERCSASDTRRVRFADVPLGRSDATHSNGWYTRATGSASGRPCG